MIAVVVVTVTPEPEAARQLTKLALNGLVMLKLPASTQLVKYRSNPPVRPSKGAKQMQPSEGRPAGEGEHSNQTCSNIISLRRSGNECPLPVIAISDLAVPPFTFPMQMLRNTTSCQPYWPNRNPCPAENLTRVVRWPAPSISNPIRWPARQKGRGA